MPQRDSRHDVAPVPEEVNALTRESQCFGASSYGIRRPVTSHYSQPLLLYWLACLAGCFGGHSDRSSAILAARELETLGAEGVYQDPDQTPYYAVTFGDRWHGGTADIQLLRRIRAIKEVHLKGPLIDDQSLKAVASIPQVRVVTIENTKVTSNGILALEHAEDLLSLSVVGVELTSEAISCISNCDLISLGLQLNHDFEDYHVNEFRHLTKLLSLKISGSGLGPNAAASIAELPALRHLDVSDSAFSDSELDRMRPLRYLTELDLSRTRVTGRQLNYLTELPHLKVLILDGLVIGNEVMPTVSQCMQLESLSLRGTQINDAGIAILGASPELRTVSFSGTPLTEAAVDILATIPTLLTIENSDGDTIVFRDGWLKQDGGSVRAELLRRARANGRRVLLRRTGGYQEVVDVDTPGNAGWRQ